MAMTTNKGGQEDRISIPAAEVGNGGDVPAVGRRAAAAYRFTRAIGYEGVDGDEHAIAGDAIDEERQQGLGPRPHPAPNGNKTWDSREDVRFMQVALRVGAFARKARKHSAESRSRAFIIDRAERR